jgi:hypothetical protein
VAELGRVNLSLAASQESRGRTPFAAAEPPYPPSARESSARGPVGLGTGARNRIKPSPHIVVIPGTNAALVPGSARMRGDRRQSAFRIERWSFNWLLTSP